MVPRTRSGQCLARIDNLMPYLRLLLAWILMLAIPVQGFAAASMLFCGPNMSHHAQEAKHQDSSGTPTHDHKQNVNEVKDSVDKGGVKLGDGKPAPDLMHKCAVCASCCNAVALPQATLIVVPEVPVHAGPDEPTVAAYSRPLLVADKPPRA